MTVKSLTEALQPLVTIARAYMENALDDEARRFWGPNTGTESENNRDPKSIELYTGRGGGTLLTLQDCFDARDTANELASATGLLSATVLLLKEPTTSAPSGCHCKGTCGAPVIMGRQQPCRRPGGVPGMPAPDAPASLLGEVSRDVDDGISGVTGAIATADARASGQQIPKKPGRMVVAGSSTMPHAFGLYDRECSDGEEFAMSEAQAFRVAALINADYNFPWDD